MSSLRRASSELKWLYDQVTFDDVPDQYVQGEEATVSFTLSQSLTTNFDRDEIGIARVGCTNIKECLAFAPIHFRASDSAMRGTATFAAASLSGNEEEFYQFGYIRNRSKTLAHSKPFQLNCPLDDIDYLSDLPIRSNGTGTVLSLSDQEHDDIVLISTETDAKSREELERTRAQLNTVTQFVKDQASQILDLERRLIQADRSLQKSNEEKLSLEQQLRDLRLTSEKYQRSAQGQIEHFSAAADPEKLLLERQLRDLRLTSEKYQLSTQGQLKSYAKQADRVHELERANRLLQEQLRSPKTTNSVAPESELQRQLQVYQKFINDLQHETKCLAERLASPSSQASSVDDGEVRQCPLCHFHFPPYFTLEQKNQHIQRHFE